MKKHQNHRYFTAVCIASAIFAVLLCLALFLIVTGDRSELDRMEAQAAVFLEQMEQAADSARQSALVDAQDNFENSMPGIDTATSAFAAASAPEAISFAVCVLTAPNSLNVLFFTPRSRRFA